MIPSVISWTLTSAYLFYEAPSRVKATPIPRVLLITLSWPSTASTMACRLFRYAPADIIGEKDDQMLLLMLNACDTSKSEFQLGDNTNLFNFSYVGSVVQAHILAARELIRASTRPVSLLDHHAIAGQVIVLTNVIPTCSGTIHVLFSALQGTRPSRRRSI